ncbi:MAG: hypothetical protein AAB964_01030 [Patescibacteria group bacterium]
MASVGAIYVARQLVSATALKLYVIVMALWALGRLVWVERVFENLSGVGVGGTFNFIAAAVFNAEVAVQATFALLIVAGLWLIRDLTRTSLPGRFA